MTIFNPEPLCEKCGRPLAEGLEELDDSPDLVCFGPSDLKCSPPILSLDAQLKSVGTQIIESEKSRNHIEFGKLGEHIDALFDAMSTLSK